MLQRTATHASVGRQFSHSPHNPYPYCHSSSVATPIKQVSGFCLLFRHTKALRFVVKADVNHQTLVRPIIGLLCRCARLTNGVGAIVFVGLDELVEHFTTGHAQCSQILAVFRNHTTRHTVRNSSRRSTNKPTSRRCRQAAGPSMPNTQFRLCMRAPTNMKQMHMPNNSQS